MENKRIKIWLLLLAFISFLVYANLEIREYNKLVRELSKVNLKLLEKMNGNQRIMSKRFEANMVKQFPNRDPQEVAMDILQYLENTGLPPIKQLSRRDSLWIVQVISNNREIDFYILEGNNSVLLDSCTNIHYICRKMASKRKLEADWAMKGQN